jgi:hypothetical protein
MDNAEAIIFGYFPLFYPKTQTQGILTECDENSIQEICTQIDNARGAFRTDGVLWGMNDGLIYPIITCNDSRNVADHINFYSEGDPESWFSFFVKEEAERYTVGLQPSIERTIARMKLINPLLNKCRVAYNTLHAVCPHSDAYRKFKTQIIERGWMCDERITVGLVDSVHVRSLKSLDVIDDSEISILGHFKIGQFPI